MDHFEIGDCESIFLPKRLLTFNVTHVILWNVQDSGFSPRNGPWCIMLKMVVKPFQGMAVGLVGTRFLSLGGTKVPSEALERYCNRDVDFSTVFLAYRWVCWAAAIGWCVRRQNTVYCALLTDLCNKSVWSNISFSSRMRKRWTSVQRCTEHQLIFQRHSCWTAGNQPWF